MFESKDPSYQGPERRKVARRTTTDRRLAIRFEVTNNDRRNAAGRRHDDTSGDVWLNFF